MTEDASRLKQRLRTIGLSDPAIDAAWPAWWSEDADASASARAELRFSLARKLGLDPHSLLADSEEPRFVWRDEARFKHLSGEDEREQAAITSFGTALGGYLVSATPPSTTRLEGSAINLRDAILHSQPYVRLQDLIGLCWSVGIPVVHLRVFPCPRKRMAAMCVRVGDASAIMLGRDSLYPPHVAFYLAHELGHIVLGHLAIQTVLVDLEEGEPRPPYGDPEETGADRFALELLTGEAEPRVLPASDRYTASQLAGAALAASRGLGIEPGTLALCFGYSTGDWARANAAICRVYSSPKPAWTVVNATALGQLDLTRVPDDVQPYLRSVLGETQPA